MPFVAWGFKSLIVHHFKPCIAEGYFVDAYDKERNIVLEYYEPAHYVDVENNVLCEKDIIRQTSIIEHLHCEFWGVQ